MSNNAAKASRTMTVQCVFDLLLRLLLLEEAVDLAMDRRLMPVADVS